MAATLCSTRFPFLPVIQEGKVRPKQAVREDYERLRPLERLKVEKRGWTLDVLQVVQSLGAGRAEATPLHKTFSLSEVYAHEDRLAKLHPKNAHVQDKIRQQLQVLRDLGLVTFLGGGSYPAAVSCKIEIPKSYAKRGWAEAQPLQAGACASAVSSSLR
ncbi:MAG TPA: hypothetical protein VE778_03150 [Candidatus Bathyarchaeia archaeon]|nr:hypothetical protein [Candidatus Bathyarchaeia archaeon]